MCLELALLVWCTEESFRFDPLADSDVRLVVPNSISTTGRHCDIRRGFGRPLPASKAEFDNLPNVVLR